MSDVEYRAPGPGVWELEQTHFSKPSTRYGGEVFPEPLARGFGEGTKRYGLLLDTLRLRTVNDFIYGQFRPVGAPEGAKGPPPKLLFMLITRLHPEIRSRVAAAPEVFANKLWRQDVERWDRHIKPDSIARNQGLQDVDPARLSDAEFIAHLEAIRENGIEMVYRHHMFTIASGFPVGHFLVEAQRMTGLPSGELLGTLKGSAPISRGVAVDELAALGAALRESGSDLGRLRGMPPEAALDTLRAAPAPVGPAVHAFLRIVGYRLASGYDVSESYALEMPAMLVNTILSAAAGNIVRAGGDARLDHVRSRVPGAERPLFDELLEEARFTHRLRDERGMYNDLWGGGLVRRGLLEAGRRLVANGVLPDAELAVSATHDEVVALLSGARSPSVDELRRRKQWRDTKTIADAPPFLGGTPSGPPPVDWLPARARPNARAIGAMIHGIFQVSEKRAAPRTVEGLPVHPGVYVGPARLVNGPADFGRVTQGDVLVARTTGPAFNVILPLLGAIVTDRGGQLSHAAIVAREYGIPSVVGTKAATTTFPDGARIRVDGDTGRVELIG
jgi:phosphohistidine swiveling domain-containing protein